MEISTVCYTYKWCDLYLFGLSFGKLGRESENQRGRNRFSRNETIFSLCDDKSQFSDGWWYYGSFYTTWLTHMTFSEFKGRIVCLRYAAEKPRTLPPQMGRPH
jgi:hypothetical protein